MHMHPNGSHMINAEVKGKILLKASLLYFLDE
uniref:Uncharacterized protein n=1 Tax=Rhizophora mucronata TaxID=61149 RepID=A0A2P2P7Y6_RHIMU